MAHASTHASADGHTEHTGHGAHHVFDAGTLKKTFGILVGLTLLTVVLALWERGFADLFGLELHYPRLPVGAFSVPIALGIAGTKVYWVASRFMGLKHEKGSNVLVFLGSTAFLVVFFAFTYLDFAFRGTFDQVTAVPKDIEAASIRDAQARAETIEERFPAPALVERPDPALFGTIDDASAGDAAATPAAPAVAPEADAATATDAN